MPADTRTVRSRMVFYIPGFDPFPPRRYRELYRSEGKAQSALTGQQIALSATDANGWKVTATAPETGTPVTSRFEVLVWSDIVQNSMGHGIAATYLQLLRTVAIYVGSGAIWRIIRLRKGPAIAALFPVVVLVLQLCVALAVAVVVASMLAPLGVAVGAALLSMWAVLWLFRRIDHRLYAYYLMHDYAFTARDGGAIPVPLKPRLSAFTDRIAAALTEDWDEVLIVGHSSGAHLAVSVLAGLIRSGRVPSGPALSLLTLGHVVPMVSFLPKAADLRGDLAYLSASDALTWVDVTAPGDGCSFALCDPVAVSGVAPPNQRWPLVISAAFTQTLSPARWKDLRWRFFRLHFQYLCAFDALPGQPDDYDYFAVTAGDRTLAARFADRKPSRSRIAVARSGYTTQDGGT